MSTSRAAPSQLAKTYFIRATNIYLLYLIVLFRFEDNAMLIGPTLRHWPMREECLSVL